MAARASILVLYFFYFLLMCSGVQLAKFKKQGPPSNDLSNSDFNKQVRNSIYEETLKTISDKLKKMKLSHDSAEKELAASNTERLQKDINKVEKILAKLRNRHRLNLDNLEKTHSYEIHKYEESIDQEKKYQLKLQDEKLIEQLEALNHEEEANREAIKKEFAEKKKELENKQAIEYDEVVAKLDETLKTILDKENDKIKDFTQTSFEKINSITDDYNEAELSIAESFGISESEIEEIKRKVSDSLFPATVFKGKNSASDSPSTFSIDASAKATSA